MTGTVPSWVRQNHSKSQSGMGQVRKYADGSEGGVSPFQGGDEDPFSAMRDTEGRTNSGPTYAQSSTNQVDERDRREAAMTKSEAPAKQTFKQAFASAKDGSIFEWNGKKYKKEYAKPASKPAATSTDKPAAKPAESAKSGSRNDKRLTGGSKSSGPGFLERMFTVNDNPRLRRERARKEAARDRDTDTGTGK